MKGRIIISMLAALCLSHLSQTAFASDKEKDKNQDKPKRVELAASEQATLNQVQMKVQQAVATMAVTEAEANGVIHGIAVSKLGLDWATRYKLIKTGDGRYAFEEVPPAPADPSSPALKPGAITDPTKPEQPKQEEKKPDSK